MLLYLFQNFRRSTKLSYGVIGATSPGRLKSREGFTLIEMLITLAIIFIMTALSMTNYNRFGKEVELENAAYELALNIRQAQFFGINRSEQFGATFDDPQPYGVYFNIDGGEEGIDDQSFFLFVDNDGNRLFNTSDNTYGGGENCVANASDECARILSFTRSNYIYSICVGDDESSCTDIGNIVTGDRELHISFKRPDPDAVIRVGSGLTEYAYAKITLASPLSDISHKSVSVGAAGLISID
ncbi:MAG: pilus assembly FimT family protein [Patescibacteria group bacterium]